MPRTTTAPTETPIPRDLQGLPCEIAHVTLFLRTHGRQGTPQRNGGERRVRLRQSYFSLFDGGKSTIVLIDKAGDAWTYPGRTTPGELPRPWVWRTCLYDLVH